jgi:hypothetical protein
MTVKVHFIDKLPNSFLPPEGGTLVIESLTTEKVREIVKDSVEVQAHLANEAKDSEVSKDLGVQLRTWGECPLAGYIIIVDIEGNKIRYFGLQRRGSI